VVKIKEIEEKSGMTRANIRFYETEGLLAPARDANGYRDYCEEDLEILLRIKLLRTLQVPLEQIKELHCGELQLQCLLEQHVAKLEMDKEQLARSQQICQRMREDGVQYQTLQAQCYLISLEQLQNGTPAWQLDMEPRLKMPLRRFFARIFDLFCYGLIALVLQELSTEPYLFTESNLFQLFFLTELYFFHLLDWLGGLALPFWLWSSILFWGGDTVGSVLLMMLVLEPAMLAKFGTTPGKWLLGLAIRDYDDKCLNYEAALSRTWQVLWYGWGLNIPFYRLVRLGKSFLRCDRGEALRWEQATVQVLQDKSKWRILLYGCCLAVILAPLFWLIWSRRGLNSIFFFL